MTSAIANDTGLPAPGGMLDIAGIGAGPSNLSLAALIETVGGVNARFFEAKSEFSWHPGMMFSGVELQSSYLKDLVTPVMPTNRWSFISYLVEKKRLYAFLNAHYDAVPRQEFAQYLAWAAEGLSNVQLGRPVKQVDYAGDHFVLHFDKGKAQSRNLVTATGMTPFVPAWAKSLMGPRCFHNSEAAFRVPDLKAERVAVIGGGQSGGEVVESLLNSRPELSVLNWFSRRHNFEPINDTAFSNQVFSPEYVHAYLSLNDEQKQRALTSSILTSDGLSLSTINAIYRRLYAMRYLEGRDLDARLSPNRDVILAEADGDRFRLVVRNRFDGGVEVEYADAIVLATGYDFKLPEALDGLRERIQFDKAGRARLDDDYCMKWDGPRQSRIFAQNAGRYSHGIADSQLSLMAWRSARIINTLLGRVHFDLEPDHSQINWRSADNDDLRSPMAVDF
jgi:lysine N6-hydroxylase